MQVSKCQDAPSGTCHEDAKRAETGATRRHPREVMIPAPLVVQNVLSETSARLSVLAAKAPVRQDIRWFLSVPGLPRRSRTCGRWRFPAMTCRCVPPRPRPRNSAALTPPSTGQGRVRNRRLLDKSGGPRRMRPVTRERTPGRRIPGIRSSPVRSWTWAISGRKDCDRRIGVERDVQRLPCRLEWMVSKHWPGISVVSTWKITRSEVGMGILNQPLGFSHHEVGVNRHGDGPAYRLAPAVRQS